jgi:hypothetical protein
MHTDDGIEDEGCPPTAGWVESGAKNTRFWQVRRRQNRHVLFFTGRRKIPVSKLFVRGLLVCVRFTPYATDYNRRRATPDSDKEKLEMVAASAYFGYQGWFGISILTPLL